jgi:polyphosphate kinase 2 (PPK2 family)
MLEKLDLDKKLKRAEWKELRLPLQVRLYDLQKAAYDLGLPVIVLFEGWDASGKGTSIGMLTQRLDPRGFKVWPIRAARTYEMNRPWLWRFWLKLPNRGEIALFDRSWYGRVLVERVEKLIPEEAWRTAYRDIADFEQMLAEDGHVIVKFWLHISREEQRRRFKLLERDPLQSWHVAPEDWEHHRKYDDYLQAAEEMLERTDTEWGPWTIVEATDQFYTLWKVLATLTDALDNGLRRRGVDTDALSAEAMAAAAAKRRKPAAAMPAESEPEPEPVAPDFAPGLSESREPAEAP